MTTDWKCKLINIIEHGEPSNGNKTQKLAAYLRAARFRVAERQPSKKYIRLRHPIEGRAPFWLGKNGALRAGPSVSSSVDVAYEFKINGEV